MSNEVGCPHCGSDLSGDPIPEKEQYLFGGSTHFSRKVGIEIPEQYDGISYWFCPDCKVVWDRFTGKIQPREFLDDYPALKERFNA